MHIGLIGGIGPAATVAYYTGLVGAFKTAGLPLELTIVHADIAKVAANAAADDREAQAEIFARHIDQLKGAGCDIATITALTGHFCFAETKRLSSLPLVNTVELIDRYCAAEKISVLGLLGSPPVLATHLFGMLQIPQTVVPTGDLDSLGQVYMEMATLARCSDQQRKLFFAAGSEMIEKQKADAVLLAGTDLGLAFTGHEPGYRVVDALDIHVAGLVSLAKG